MSDRFFDRPILNTFYVYPSRCWELNECGQQGELVEVINELRRRNPRHGQR